LALHTPHEDLVDFPLDWINYPIIVKLISNNNKFNKRQGRKPNRGMVKSNQQGGRILMKPPQLKTNVSLNHVYRFVSTTATATVITNQNLLFAAGTVVATATSVYSMYSSVRVKRVSIWTPPPSQGSNSTCSVEWIGGANTNNSEFSDTTVSTAQPAMVSCQPPVSSLAHFWSNSGSSLNLFTIVAPSGSIIDISLALILNDNENGPLLLTVVAGTPGNAAYIGMDGLATATTKFKPVSLSTL
jgi:hypothetical protein